MKKYLLILIVFFINFCFVSFVFSQNSEIDSLKNALRSNKEDTSKANTLNILSNRLWKIGNYDSSLTCANQALSLSIKNKFDKGQSNALNTIGIVNMFKGNYSEALNFYSKSLVIKKKLNDKKGIAGAYNNMGMIYESQCNYPKALEFHLKALKIKEDLKDDNAISSSLINIGDTYESLGNRNEALEYYNKAIKIQLKIGDNAGLSQSYNNIGVNYSNMLKFDKALEYTLKSLKIRQELNDKHGISVSLNNIGNIYQNQAAIIYSKDSIVYQRKLYEKAIDYFVKAIKLKEEIGDVSELSILHYNLGLIFYDLKKFNVAKKHHNTALKLANDLGEIDALQYSYLGLAKVDSATGNFNAAFQNYKMYILFRDSILNKENTKKTVQLQMQFEFDKKTAADSLKAAEERKVIDAQMKQEKTQRYALYGGLALVIVFAIFMYNRFRVTHKQKQIIEIKEKETQQQKHIIEEKHKEITDSINYAERIQRSFLATKELLDENLNDYFVLFQPKDVVSGDFYWATKLSNGNFALATADSTGHGVPGAIMSLLNITSLESAIKDGHTQPAEILNATRKTIIERLKKDGSEEGGKDGMDCSLTVYDFKQNKLFVTAANNPVWIVRGSEVIEIKPDKMPVGKHDKQDVLFTQHEIDLQNGDVVYTLTDGFPDQFGGESGKKFMSKKLRELLLANANLPMQDQKKMLQTTFKNWVGDLEQVDDICVIGVRV